MAVRGRWARLVPAQGRAGQRDPLRVERALVRRETDEWLRFLDGGPKRVGGSVTLPLAQADDPEQRQHLRVVLGLVVLARLLGGGTRGREIALGQICARDEAAVPVAKVAGVGINAQALTGHADGVVPAGGVEQDARHVGERSAAAVGGAAAHQLHGVLAVRERLAGRPELAVVPADERQGVSLEHGIAARARDRQRALAVFHRARCVPELRPAPAEPVEDHVLGDAAGVADPGQQGVERVDRLAITSEAAQGVGVAHSRAPVVVQLALEPPVELERPRVVTPHGEQHVELGKDGVGLRVVARGAAQIELRQRRPDVVEAPPGRGILPRLPEEAGPFGQQRDLRLARDPSERVGLVGAVQVVAARLLAHELHADQSVEHRRRSLGHRGGRHAQQRIDGLGGDGPGVDRQRLHRPLGGGVEPAERFADQRVHHVLGEDRGGVVQHLAQARPVVERQDLEQRFERARVALGAFARLRQQRVGRRLQPQLSVGVPLAQDVLGER